MILSQILYQKGTERKSVLVLILGRKGNKLVAILDEAINSREGNAIGKNSKTLDGYPLYNKVSWMKSNAPEAYKKGYREFIISKVEVQKSFSLTTKKYVQTSARAS